MILERRRLVQWCFSSETSGDVISVLIIHRLLVRIMEIVQVVAQRLFMVCFLEYIVPWWFTHNILHSSAWRKAKTTETHRSASTVRDYNTHVTVPRDCNT